MIAYLPFIGAFIISIGHITYIKSICRGFTKPNKITWFFWGLSPLIAFSASIVHGFYRSVLPIFMVGFGPMVIFIIACYHKNSYWELGRFDYICGLCALVGLLLRRYTKNPNIAIIFAIISDALAALPTVNKVRKYPETESMTVYITSLCAMCTSLIGVQTRSFNVISFPIYLVILDASVIVIMIMRKKNIKKTLS